ncbi:SDR family NAD(P)-dependent oxidoreductase [Seohaeicola zhoushanensis]|uniref:Beta-ketoacyl-ACP reductase n=1 Tax=Seohaeicola zhoushanensis TaxID=1569283 RepID=A0A8J3GZM7_9RHOB|nr:SDR family NAD(P)-dependent oxidoreductase [Seohaeicola zhoushanensis]GHF62348.1 beta-ketoacyl-ACP reductase [Seohaeicola zhoushanensis]
MVNYGLKGRVIAITGGASGIGRSAALSAATDGAHVAVLDVNQDNIDKTLAELRAKGVKAEGYALDVRDEVAMGKVAKAVESDLGPVYGLFSSAGISRTAPAEKVELADFEAVLDVNVNGVFLAAREFAQAMIQRGRGAIVNVGSIDGLGGHPGRLHYVSSKHAVAGLTKSLALEWGRYGIRVNAIMPGFVDTPLLRANMPEKYIERVVYDRTPLGRMANSDEIAAVAMMLLSDSASYMSGAIVPVDGGMTAGFLTRGQGGDYASKNLLSQGVYSE